jgi:putative oxidoreductase
MSARSIDLNDFQGLSPLDRFAAQAQDALLLAASVLLAAMFIQSGFAKLMNVDGFSASLASRGVPLAEVWGIVGAGVEFFGSLAVLLGVKTRSAAVLMALFVVVATLISHRYWEFAEMARRTQMVNFQKNVCIIGGYLVLLVAGDGRFSVDGLLGRKS